MLTLDKTFRWIAMAAKKYNYLLSDKLDIKTPVSWTTFQFKDDLRKGQKVLLMQTFGKSIHPLRGIYGVGIIDGYDIDESENNVDIRYIQKFTHPIPLHAPFTPRVLEIFENLQTPKLGALLSGKSEAQRNLQPVDPRDLPYLNEAFDLLEKDFETAKLPDDELIVAAMEGKKLSKIHIQRERKRSVIEAAKSKFMNEHNGRLYCTVCGFDFLATYGGRGYGFIEGHHTLPLSRLSKERETRIEDISILCSNCHRMIHNKQPWLNINQLRALVRRNKP